MLQRRPTGWKVISVLDTAYHPNIEADDVDDYNETYIINSELWSMIRDHKEMRAKYRFKSQQPAPMDESARPRRVVGAVVQVSGRAWGAREPGVVAVRQLGEAAGRGRC